ncbi:MAG: sporulation integral membrane protein YtvI [Oscillospiraceae bacterium]|nr:sporulation integral membrane protein YtvI [Oscillospiraceae bacterium]
MKELVRPAKFFVAFLGVILALKYFLPYLIPFAAALVIALLSEPLVGFCVKYFRLPRSVGAGIGVSVTLLLTFALLSVVGALAVKELGMLANALPDMENTAKEGIALVEDLLTDAASKAPKGMRPFLLRSVSGLFSQKSELFSQVGAKIPGMVTDFLGQIPTGALTVGTSLLASFMISARLPQLRSKISAKLPTVWKDKYLPALRRSRKVVGSWLKAQLQISAVVFLIVGLGFLLLKVPYGPLWAALIALVDAVPILGTGTVLIPWAVISLLQGNHLQAIGLFVIYGAALLARTALEPKLVGRQLGLDPLATLICLYLGFRIWGIFGMLTAPILAAAVKNVLDPQQS